MTIQAGAHRGSTAAAHPIALAADRARQFSSARRHTYVVQLLKLVLPSVAVVSAGVYGAALFATNKIKAIGVDPGKITIDPKNLTMEAPKYNGIGKDGSHYVVRAKEAMTDLKQTGPVRLNVIDGEITQQTGVVTKLKANWGTYDQKADVLELYEKIDIDGSTGMKARLTRATVFPKESRIVSNEPVQLENETGNIRSRQMTFNSKERKGTFTDQVHVMLKAAPAKAETADGSQKAKTQSALPGLAANSGEPIEIRSERLDFDDGAKTALFRQDVIAKQGDATLQATELDVLYEGKAAIDGTAPPKPKNSEAQVDQPQSKLKTIKARGGVTMINKDDRANASTLDYDAASETALLKGNVVMTSGNERRATSSEAQFDQKRDTALLTGNVIVQQGKNVLKGQRLFVDRKAGTTRLESPAGPGQSAGRINTVFYQAENKQGAAKAPAKAAQEAVVSAATAVAASTSPFAFKTDPTKPIDIDADTLDVFDQKRLALFLGNVIAKQGTFIVQTSQMTAHYTGQAGIASGSPVGAAAKGAKGESGQGAQLTKVEARKQVIVTGNDGQRATGEWADFDVKANTVKIGGNVFVSEGPEGKKNVVYGAPGDELHIDMTTGISKFIKPDNAIARAVPAVSANPAAKAPEPGQQSQRLRAVFFPKEQAKAAADGAKQKVQKKSKTGASSWEATTSGTTAGEKR